ncbi:MAG: HAD family hydrolase [Lachnospiraceae bacterium]
MIQYIASDLDGTLLRNNATELNPLIFDQIRRLKERGILFIAASGRQYHSIRHLFAPVKDDIAYVAENGSLCICQGEVISRGLIGRELGLRIIDAGREYKNCHPLVSCESTAYTDSKDEQFARQMKELFHNKVEYIPDLYDVKEPFLKLAMCDFKGTDMLMKYFKDRFASEISIVTSGNIWVDFIAPNANKGSALEGLLNHLGLSAKNGIAFGDQYNDVEMLEVAGTSYAMATAAPGIAYYADYVTRSVEEVVEDVLAAV